MNNNISTNSSSIVSKIWAFCHTLRDDGVSYGDYLEQLTYLLFLKMAHEYTKPPHNRQMNIPPDYDWETLTQLTGTALESHYNTILRELGKEKGILGQIFVKSQNKIQDPAKLFRLIALIDAENWILMGVKDKGDIYEGLLEKNAEDTKSGAGQYFTPRPVIKTMVACMRPEPLKTIADPACGTGGFFLAAYDWLVTHRVLDKEQKRFLKYETFAGNEIVASTRRLALMNLFLHHIGDMDAAETAISPMDSLLNRPQMGYDYVLANPPFGKKSSMTFTNEDGEQEKEDLMYNRPDFWVTTSNKQLNFVQHICSMLKTTGQAAVVLPDNVLFEGGAGETIRKNLIQTTDLHTILRLPTGIFYAQGVKANVLFFDNKPADKNAWTKEVWIYDYRTNIHHTLKKNPLKTEDLNDFVSCYNPENRHQRVETWSEAQPNGRFRKFTYDEILNRDKTNLDIAWLKDETLTDLENLPDPDELALEIVENLEAGLLSFKAIIAALGKV
jgi:type I restriction enzyme M protein